MGQKEGECRVNYSEGERSGWESVCLGRGGGTFRQIDRQSLERQTKQVYTTFCNAGALILSS